VVKSTTSWSRPEKASLHCNLNVLAFDTSTTRAVIGLGLQSGAIFSETTHDCRKHGRDLIPSIARVLALGPIRPRALEAIGVGVGPGSYTGLRVGVTAAKTLAYATGAGLVGIDSLEAIAWNAPEDVLRVAVVADAQRSDVYSADFARTAARGILVCTRSTQIEPLEAWQARLTPGLIVLGPGLDSPRIAAKVPPELLPSDSSMNYPTGIHLLALASREWTAGHRENPWLLEPRYLRMSSAEEKKSREDRPAERSPMNPSD
jgi:tRNA threonylcarbamoyladenosine biosynthesis protein TsaB